MTEVLGMEIDSMIYVVVYCAKFGSCASNDVNIKHGDSWLAESHWLEQENLIYSKIFLCWVE